MLSLTMSKWNKYHTKLSELLATVHGSFFEILHIQLQSGSKYQEKQGDVRKPQNDHFHQNNNAEVDAEKVAPGNGAPEMFVVHTAAVCGMSVAYSGLSVSGLPGRKCICVMPAPKGSLRDEDGKSDFPVTFECDGHPDSNRYIY